MLKVDLTKEYMEKALEQAAGAATRASNSKGINALIREFYQKDAKLFMDAARSIVEVK